MYTNIKILRLCVSSTPLVTVMFVCNQVENYQLLSLMIKDFWEE